MMMMVRRDNHRRPFPSSQTNDASDGPTYNVVGGATPASSGGAAAAPLRGAAAAAGGMTTFLGFPFTNAQWKELERQAMIYKYIVASLPVPRDLLFPNPRNPSAPPVFQPPFGGFNLRLSNSTDPEPGRCKRTDGKKWRCSREAARDQKYCERHMHRGRPRSRKHVEVQPNAAAAKRPRHDISSAPPPPPPIPATASFYNPAINKNVSSSQFIGSSVQQCHGSPLFLGRDCVNAPTFDSSDREPRSIDWLMMKGESIQMATSDQHWHHLMQSKTELSDSTIPFFDANSSIFSHNSPQESFLNLNSYTNIYSGENQQENECNMFLNSEVISLENPMLDETPRFLIDAWSQTVIDDKDNGSAPSSGQLSPSSLTLSMGGYNSISEEMGQSAPQISLGSNGNGIKAPRLSTWLTPTSWVDSAPGGPLAEVLKPTTSAASNPSSPVTAGANNGELGSPLATVVSSPSGVVQKTFASVSDSSGNSSPTTLASSSRANPEVVSLWLNQNKA